MSQRQLLPLQPFTIESLVAMEQWQALQPGTRRKSTTRKLVESTPDSPDGQHVSEDVDADV